MKKQFIAAACAIILFIGSCKKEEVANLDNPDIVSMQIDSTLKNFYVKPTPSSTFEQVYSYSFATVDCGFSINLYWYDPAESHGIYLHFNNNVGDVLTDANGFIKAFDSGIKIDSTLSGNWSGISNDGIFSLDYVSNPSANKGNLAGKGDKYIAFRAFSDTAPQLKYYGWLRVSVSANGREIKVLSVGFQKNANTALKTGEL